MQHTLRHYYYECSLHSIYYYPQQSCKHEFLSLSFFTLRVLETVPSVPTSEMDCSVCLAVLKACQGRMTCLCGNTQMRWKCASYVTKTAPKGKSIVNWPENWQCIFTMLQTFVCCNLEAEIHSKPEGSSVVGADWRVTLAFNMRQFFLRLMMKSDN